MIKTEYFALTGETKELPFTEDDLAQHKADQALLAKAKASAKAEAEAKETAKTTILDRIGLTADELKTILG
jgi:hypothetical protein